MGRWYPHVPGNVLENVDIGIIFRYNEMRDITAWLLIKEFRLQKLVIGSNLFMTTGLL